MMLWEKITAALLAGCIGLSSAALPAAAEAATTTAATEVAEEEAATEAATEEATEEITEPEELTAGDFTYYVSEELGGAIVTHYTADQANVVLPDTIAGQPLVGLESHLFSNQTKLKTLTLPDSLAYIGSSVFYGSGVEEFIVSENNQHLQVIDGVLFSKDGTVLVAYPPKAAAESYVVPDGVTELYSGCFAQAGNLHELTLPEGLQRIGSWAFGYSELNTLEFPESVETLGSYSCAYMKRIETIRLNEGLTSVGAAAFAGCAQLRDVWIPNTVTQIAQGAFAGTAMKYAAIPSSVETIGYCAFGYKTDMETRKGNFVIYGVAGSAAQNYAKDTDTEYDYKNEFTFVAKTDAQIAAGVKDPNAESTRPEALAGQTPDSQTTTAITAEGDSSSTEDDNSNFGFIMKIVLFALGGVVLCGGIAAVVLSSRKKQ